MILTEGKVKLDLPVEPVRKGPGKRKEGFYNLSQRINRDITLIFLQSIRPKLFLDAFGGSGIRGLRVKSELGIQTVISEINPASFRIAEKNARLNGLDVELCNENFEKTLERYLFDFIDVDPYGSIIPFVDRALTSVKNHGHIGVTATDLSALTGSVPSKTYRRYGATIRNDAFKHEMGLRLLISYVVKRAAAFDIAAVPQIAFWHSHFYRIIFKVDRGAGKADNALKQVSYIDKKELAWDHYKTGKEGPIWIGSLNHGSVLEDMNSSHSEFVENDALRLLSLLENEDLSFLFLEVIDVAKQVKTDIPPMKILKEEIEKTGMNVASTHFSHTGFKVSGSLREAYLSVEDYLRKSRA